MARVHGEEEEEKLAKGILPLVHAAVVGSDGQQLLHREAPLAQRFHKLVLALRNGGQQRDQREVVPARRGKKRDRKKR